MLQNLSSAAVEIGALSVKLKVYKEIKQENKSSLIFNNFIYKQIHNTIRQNETSLAQNKSIKTSKAA